MKVVFLLFLLSCLRLEAQNKFYDLNVETAYGGKFSMHQYSGQKVLIAAVNIDNIKKKAALQFWDSLKTANPKVAFILIPISEADSSSADSTAMQDLKRTTNDKLVLSGLGHGKKDKGDKQHPILQWLTDDRKNKHFNLDLESDVQIYVISESGELYSVLTKDTKLSFLNQVLQQPDVTPTVFDVTP